MSRQMAQLLGLLVTKTQSGVLSWEQGPSADAYVTQIGNNSILIRTQREDYLVSIFNENGSVVESFTDVSLSQDGIESAFEGMRDLHEMARRNALGADRVINDILNELSKS
ncbi:hypothetical protein [Mesorhizobium marinum]|uniref:Uncharacterized protein n=1 Tax=Mesorhizobium marinum TaxID=3228790 RepID=A0ABV3QWV7_9HYPH